VYVCVSTNKPIYEPISGYVSPEVQSTLRQYNCSVKLIHVCSNHHVI